jgi:membrane protease YdiL (CAAX protease family)
MSRVVGIRGPGQYKWRWSPPDEDQRVPPAGAHDRAGGGLSCLALSTGRAVLAPVAGMKAGGAAGIGAVVRLGAAAWPGVSPFSALVLPAYAAAIFAAEVVTALVDARWGVGFHVAILWALLLHFSQAEKQWEGRILLALCLAPLIRILSLGMPLENVQVVYRYLIVSVPMIVAAFVVARTVGLTRYDLGLTIRAVPVQLLVGAVGVGLGVAEYFILRPEPLVDELTWQQAWWPAMILLVATGFSEELVFRGVMQAASTDALGRVGILYVAIVFAALHVGHRSAADVVFVFVVALFFGWVVAKTRSLLGVTLSHGIANIVLYIVVPFTAIALN